MSDVCDALVLMSWRRLEHLSSLFALYECTMTRDHPHAASCVQYTQYPAPAFPSLSLATTRHPHHHSTRRNAQEVQLAAFFASLLPIWMLWIAILSLSHSVSLCPEKGVVSYVSNAHVSMCVCSCPSWADQILLAARRRRLIKLLAAPARSAMHALRRRDLLEVLRGEALELE